MTPFPGTGHIYLYIIMPSYSNIAKNVEEQNHIFLLVISL